MFGIRIVCRVDLRSKVTETGGKRGVVAEKSAWPMTFDKLPSRLAPVEVMDKNSARFAGGQEPERQFQRAKFFWAINENCIPGLKPLREYLARVPVEKFDIRVRPELRFGDGRMRWIEIKLNAHNSRLRETTGQHEGALATHAARFQDLFRTKRTHRRIKEKHSAGADAFESAFTWDSLDRTPKIGQQPIGSSRYRRCAKRRFVPGVAHMLINGGSLPQATRTSAWNFGHPWLV
jgi:hypothetical protein